MTKIFVLPSEHKPRIISAGTALALPDICARELIRRSKVGEATTGPPRKRRRRTRLEPGAPSSNAKLALSPASQKIVEKYSGSSPADKAGLTAEPRCAHPDKDLRHQHLRGGAGFASSLANRGGTQMSEARVLPFRRPPSREPFLAVERLPELRGWQSRLAHERHGAEAYLIGESYLVALSLRLRNGDGPFLHDRQAAHAVDKSPCVYRRRREQFPDFFAFVDDQLERAFGRLSGKKPTEKPITFLRTYSTKSKAGRAQTFRPEEEEPLIKESGEAPYSPPIVDLAEPERVVGRDTFHPTNGGSYGRRERRPRQHHHDVPADWQPDDTDRWFARDQGHDEPWIDRQAERFRAYHRAHGTRFADLNEAWRSWVLKAADFAPRPSGDRPRVGKIAAACSSVISHYAAAAYGT
jgi:hypothetical protein